MEAMRGTRGEHISLDHYQPSDDGRLVAYGLAQGGGEITEVRVIETETGHALPDTISRIWGEFEVSWQPDGSGFYYTQMAAPAPGGAGGDPLQNMRAFFHRLGDPTDRDIVIFGPRAEFGPHFETQEFPLIKTIRGSRWVVGLGRGSQSEMRVFVARMKDLRRSSGKSPWVNVAEYADHIEDWAVHGDDLYLLSSKDAPNRRILRVSLENPHLTSAGIVVSESSDVIEGLTVDAKALYVRKNRSGRSRLERIPFNSHLVEQVALPFEGWINNIVTDPRLEGGIMRIEGWTHAESYFSFDSKSRLPKEVPLVETPDLGTSMLIAEEVEAKSGDGTLVPLTILRRRDLVKDGLRPAILEGYGAYGDSLTPRFRATHIAWLERGGIYAYAHVRGGGRKGKCVAAGRQRSK